MSIYYSRDNFFKNYLIAMLNLLKKVDTQI